MIAHAICQEQVVCEPIARNTELRHPMSDDAGIKYEYRATGALRGSLFPSNDMAGPTRSTPKGADTAAWTSGLTPYGMQRRPVGDWESFEWDDDAEGEESDD